MASQPQGMARAKARGQKNVWSCLGNSESGTEASVESAPGVSNAVPSRRGVPRESGAGTLRLQGTLGVLGVD